MKAPIRTDAFGGSIEINMWINKQKKSRFAIVVVGTNSYLPAINGIINGLDYYGNKVDLHFIHDKLPEEYLKEIESSDLNYRLVLQDFSEQEKLMLKEYPGIANNIFQRWTYLRYWYLAKIKDEYQATAMLDGDSIVVNNITPWFEFVSGTDYLLTTYHIFGSFELENYNEDNIHFVQPVFNHPLICDPKKWSDIFHFMLKREEIHHEPDMFCLNKSLLLNKRIDKVIPLLDCRWVGGYIWVSPLRKVNLGGKDYLIGIPQMFRMNVLHGKWWGRGFRENQINGAASGNKETMRNNLKMIYELYKKLNEKHKVKFPLPEEF